MRSHISWRTVLTVAFVVAGFLCSRSADAQVTVTWHSSGCSIPFQAQYANGTFSPGYLLATGVPQTFFPPPGPGGQIVSMLIDGAWYTPPPVTVTDPLFPLSCASLTSLTHTSLNVYDIN